MESLYADIAARTGGNIYIGVVGPVRTGKSTFIKRFMETMVLPRIENEPRRSRAADELPQSAAGRCSSRGKGHPCRAAAPGRFGGPGAPRAPKGAGRAGRP